MLGLAKLSTVLVKAKYIRWLTAHLTGVSFLQDHFQSFHFIDYQKIRQDFRAVISYFLLLPLVLNIKLMIYGCLIFTTFIIYHHKQIARLNCVSHASQPLYVTCTLNHSLIKGMSTPHSLGLTHLARKRASLLCPDKLSDCHLIFTNLASSIHKEAEVIYATSAEGT